ncbi:MAG: hypothetical protein M3384_17205 [Acidobacteriota bacterium]|nr:hypothetical protein [Acidobacteriota bacterium]
MSIFQNFYRKIVRKSVWARPEMSVTFRAELMPGKNRDERTFRIAEVLANDRVILHGFTGEHRESEFEPIVENAKRKMQNAKWKG